MSFRITPLGSSALTLELPGCIDAATVRKIRAACDWLESPALPGVTELVPAATTLTLFYSPLALVEAGAPAHDLAGWLAARIEERLFSAPACGHETATRLVEVPVCYEAAFAPDLEVVSAKVKLSVAEVTEFHHSAEYSVLQLGFAPGFPYLHGLPAALAVPRLATPRTVVPAGSVGIANGQSCIYPIAIPGGWHLIGRTPLKLFRPEQNPPSLLQPGDRVKFVPISATEFSELEAAP